MVLFVLMCRRFGVPVCWRLDACVAQVALRSDPETYVFQNDGDEMLTVGAATHVKVWCVWPPKCMCVTAVFVCGWGWGGGGASRAGPSGVVTGLWVRGGPVPG